LFKKKQKANHFYGTSKRGGVGVAGVAGVSVSKNLNKNIYIVYMNYHQQKFMRLLNQFGSYKRVNNLCVFRRANRANCVYIEDNDLLEMLGIL
jgi:hypothetical protein